MLYNCIPTCTYHTFYRLDHFTQGVISLACELHVLIHFQSIKLYNSALFLTTVMSTSSSGCTKILMQVQ